MEKTGRMYGGLLPPGMIGSFGGFMGAPPPPPPASNFYDFSALQHHQQQQQRLLHQQQQAQRPSSNSATSNSSTSGSSLTPSTTSAAAGCPGGPLGSTLSGNPALDALSPCSTSSASALHSELFNAASKCLFVFYLLKYLKSRIYGL